jgi:ribonuclease J
VTQELIETSTLRVVPLGGVGEFGANMTAFVQDGQVLVVDCGMSFPEAFRLGIDAVIPDAFAALTSLGKVIGWVLTHAHEDHFGALPHFLRRFPAPVFASPWTAGMLRLKLERHDMTGAAMIHEVTPGSTTSHGALTVEWLPINHSIPMACSLLIRAPETTVFHSGDYRLGEDDSDWYRLLMARLASASSEGVDYALLDSTNASSPGVNHSEEDVAEALKTHLAQAKGAVFVTTFSSHFERIQTVLEAAQEVGRKLWIVGQGMENTISIARSVDAWNPPEGATVGEHEAPWLPRHELVILLTGSQAEPRSALYRILAGEDRRISVESGDMIIFSARLIPGNEKAVYELHNKALRQGAHIITTHLDPKIHVSGHACQDEIRALIRKLAPRFVIPIHGTWAQQSANRELAQLEGAACPIIPTNGDVLELGHEGPALAAHLEIPRLYVDTDSLIPMSWETLRERLRIGEQGLAIVSGVFHFSSREWISAPKLLVRGVALGDVITVDELAEDVSDAVQERLKTDLLLGIDSLETLLENIRVTVRRVFSSRLGKKPIVLPVLHFLKDNPQESFR